MEIGTLARGLVIGAAVAAPIGPMSLLVIQRTLAQGRGSGLVSGLGIASADALYSGVAAFGLASISNAVLAYELWLRVVGGVFLCWMGLRTLRAARSEVTQRPQAGSAVRGYGSMLLLTLTNPTTVLSFAAIFAGLGVAGAGGDHGAAGVLVLGVFAGSTLWWLILTSGLSLLRGMVTPGMLRLVNRGAGVAIVAAGLLSLASAVR